MRRAALALFLASAAVGQPPALVPVESPDTTSLEAMVAAQLDGLRELLLPVAESASAPSPERAKAFGDLGRHYHAYGLLRPAASCYRNASTLAPGEFSWHYYLGRVLQQEGRLEEALATLERALDIRPDDLPALIAAAEIEIDLNRPESAERHLAKVREIHPRSVSALALEGQLALSREDWQAAVEALEAALAEVPEADRLYYSLGQAYRGLGDMEKAREHLAARGPAGVRPPDPLMAELRELAAGETVHLLRGRQAYRVGRYEEAVEAFRAAVAANPQSARARVDLGAALGETGEIQAAVEELGGALEADPDNAGAHYNLGLLREKQGRTEAAISHLRRAMELEPDDAGARMELARIFRRQERFDLALPLYQSALQIDPASPVARVGLAECLVRLGRFPEAGESLEEAHRIDPSDGRIAHALARFLAGCPELELRDGARSLDLATRVFRASPGAYHAETVAMALAETGRCDEAATWQRQVLSAAEPRGDLARIGELERVLALYEAGPPCRYVAPEG